MYFSPTANMNMDAWFPFIISYIIINVDEFRLTVDKVISVAEAFYEA